MIVLAACSRIGLKQFNQYPFAIAETSEILRQQDRVLAVRRWAWTMVVFKLPTTIPRVKTTPKIKARRKLMCPSASTNWITWLPFRRPRYCQSTSPSGATRSGSPGVSNWR